MAYLGHNPVDIEHPHAHTDDLLATMGSERSAAIAASYKR